MDPHGGKWAAPSPMAAAMVSSPLRGMEAVLRRGGPHRLKDCETADGLRERFFSLAFQQETLAALKTEAVGARAQIARCERVNYDGANFKAYARIFNIVCKGRLDTVSDPGAMACFAHTVEIAFVHINLENLALATAAMVEALKSIEEGPPTRP